MILTDDITTIFEARTPFEFTSKDLYKLFRVTFMDQVAEWRTAAVREDPTVQHPRRTDVQRILENVVAHMEEQRDSEELNQYSKYSAGILQMLRVFVAANNPLDLYDEMVHYAAENLNAPRVQVNNNIQFSDQMGRMFGSMQEFFESNFFDSLSELVQIEETMWSSRNTNEGGPNPQPTQEDIAGFFTTALSQMQDERNNDRTHYFQYSEGVFETILPFLTADNNPSILFAEIVSFMRGQAGNYGE